MRRRKVMMATSENFFNRMDLERRRLQNETGIRNISNTDMTDLIARNFPRIKLTNINIKNGKRKKSFS